MIRSRSAFCTLGLDLSVDGSRRREQAGEPGSLLLLGIGLHLELRLRRLLQGLFRLGVRFVVDDAHQLLITPALGEALEVAADRGAHLVEMTLFAHCS
jgi:hypothetical protein